VEHGSHWAEVSGEPFTWGQRNKIRDAADGPFFESFAVTLVANRVTAWSYDTDPSDPASWEPVDDGFGDAVLTAALKAWKDAPDPNDSSAPSAPSPAERPSETPNKSS
jgi:hypothetical protein